MIDAAKPVDPDAERPTDRQFGFALATGLLILGLWPLSTGATVRVWAIAAGLVVATSAMALPKVLSATNRAWTCIGHIVGGMAGRITLVFVYIFVVTPTGIVMRLMRKDPLRLRMDRHARSYWIHRDPPGPTPDSFSRQY